jgi:hypothetical protein
MWQKEKVRFKHSWIKKQPYKKSFKVSHTLDGLSSLLDFIKEAIDEATEKVIFCKKLKIFWGT